MIVTLSYSLLRWSVRWVRLVTSSLLQMRAFVMKVSSVSEFIVLVVVIVVVVVVVVLVAVVVVLVAIVVVLVAVIAFVAVLVVTN